MTCILRPGEAGNYSGNAFVTLLGLSLNSSCLGLGSSLFGGCLLGRGGLGRSLAADLAAFALAGAFLAAADLGFTEDVRLRVAFLGSSTTGGL